MLSSFLVEGLFNIRVREEPNETFQDSMLLSRAVVLVVCEIVCYCESFWPTVFEHRGDMFEANAMRSLDQPRDDASVATEIRFKRVRRYRGGGIGRL